MLILLFLSLLHDVISWELRTHAEREGNSRHKRFLHSNTLQCKQTSVRGNYSITFLIFQILRQHHAIQVSFQCIHNPLFCVSNHTFVKNVEVEIAN